MCGHDCQRTSSFFEPGCAALGLFMPSTKGLELRTPMLGLAPEFVQKFSSSLSVPSLRSSRRSQETASASIPPAASTWSHGLVEEMFKAGVICCTRLCNSTRNPHPALDPASSYNCRRNSASSSLSTLPFARWLFRFAQVQHARLMTFPKNTPTHYNGTADFGLFHSSVTVNMRMGTWSFSSTVSQPLQPV